MADSVTDVLRERREELEGIEELSNIRVWHSKVRPVIGRFFPDELKEFDAIVNIRLAPIPRTVTFGDDSRPDNLYRRNATRAANKRRVENTKERLLAQVDALIELESIGTVPESVAESDGIFQEIENIIAASSISNDHKTIVAYDVGEAQRSYNAQSYKSTVVMLGGALEGFMLGTLQRADVVTFLQTPGSVIPAQIQNIGTGHPNFSDKIGDDLTFEDYRVSLNQLIAGIAGLGVDNIQSFRNAIHPWKCMQNPEHFATFDRARALHYITSFQKIIETMANWTP